MIQMMIGMLTGLLMALVLYLPLFTSGRSNNVDLYVINADGSNLKRLTQDPKDGNQGQWSPSNHRIAYISLSQNQWDLYTILPNGTGRTRVTNDDALELAFDWLPNSNKILFESKDGIYQANVVGSKMQQMTDNPRDASPTWKPSSKDFE